MQNNGILKLILERFNSVEKYLDKISDTMRIQHGENQKRITNLEKSRAKFIGIFIALWAVAGLTLSAITILGFNGGK